MDAINKRIIELLNTTNLPTVDILDQSKETISQIGNDILDKLNTFVLTTLQLPIDKILLKLRKRTDNIFLTVDNFAWIIWNRINHQQQINEYEVEFLKNVGILNKTMVDLDIDEHDIKCFCMIEYVTAPMIFKKEFINIFESIIKNIQYYEQNFSIINIICQWLDTISSIHYFLRMKNRHLQHQQDPFTKLITTIIISPIYRQSIEKNCQINIEINPIAQFYISSCSFYYAFISNLGNWTDIIEPLFYYIRKFIIFHSQSTSEQWSSNIFYCIKSSITLITQYYENIYSNRYLSSIPMIKKPNIYFDNTNEYVKSILNILNNKSIQNKLLFTWSNDETIAIDMIITYFLRLIISAEQIKYNILHFLRTNDTIDTIYSLILKDDLYRQLQTRLFTLFSFLVNDTILNQFGFTNKITILYYTRIEKTLTRLLLTKDDIEEDNMQVYLADFVNILKNDLIQEEMIKLNKLDFFLNLEDRFYCIKKCEILWILSFHSSIKPCLKNIPFLSSSRHNIRLTGHQNEYYIDQAIWGILWNLGDHQGLTRIRQKYKNEHWDSRNMENCISIVDYDVIINYYESDREQVEKLTKNLRGYGIRPLLYEFPSTHHVRTNILIDIMEGIGSIKHYIICLSENCARSQFCKAILQYIHKKQLIIIPIIVENKYTITHDWLYYIIGSLSTIYFDDIEMMSQLTHRITNHDTNLITEYENQLPPSNDDNVTEDSLHDLYNDCKNNEIEKIKGYISEMTIRQINKQQSNGSTPLHVSAYYGHYEIVKLLLSHGAWRSIRNKHHLTAYEEARTEKIRQLLLRNNDNYYFITDINDNNVLEWIIVYDKIKPQRTLFRQQFLGSTNVSLDCQRILERFQKYYLQKLPFEPKLRASLNLYFTMAAEDDDLRYVLSAYTSPTIFHKVLNRDLATCALHYFDSTLKKTQDYSFSNSIIDLIALLIHSNQLDSFYSQNNKTTYRGMLMTLDDLKKYNVGSQIMNVTFLSTSTNKQIAEIFAGQGAIDSLRQTPDHIPIHLSTLCTYHIKNPRTALQIAGISEVSAEEEILILPFSAYEIVSIRKCDEKKNNGIMMQIELEECDETT